MISDCHCAALISLQGSVDWCCMPRFDEDSCFGRLLDWEKGGYCQICPTDERASVRRHYVDHTMVLSTTFSTPDGEAVLHDFFSLDWESCETCFDHVRIVEGVRGEVMFSATVMPRFDYGDIRPHLRQTSPDIWAVTGSNKGLIIQSEIPFALIESQSLTAQFPIHAGERKHLVMRFEFPDRIDEAVKQPLYSRDTVDRGFERTCAWWRDWCARAKPPFELDAQTIRSLVVLKSLTYEPTGAVIAAPTTSLPESLGGERNWDYRYTWIRDSVFVVRVLQVMGYEKEAQRFYHFIQRTCAGSAEQLQIMYGIDGKRRLTEIELDYLEGYRGSSPVRIGNHASRQHQADIFGSLMIMAWQWRAAGHSDDEYRDFLQGVVEVVCNIWSLPDHGIWEMRSEPRHFVHSKAMCWAALDCGMKMAKALDAKDFATRWQQVRDDIRTAIETRGYDAQRGIFVQAFDKPYLDASLLLLPRIGFIDYRDPRMMRTVAAIREDLDEGGLICRYKAADGLPGGEGTFLPCTFWLATCLARQGQTEDAWLYYNRAVECANDVGLLPEEYDTISGTMLGNFPQALTHVAQIAARMALAGTG